MTALRSRLATDVLRPGELLAEWCPHPHEPGRGRLGVVVGLSHNAEAAGYFRPPYDREVRAIAAAGIPTVIPGSSGTSWGNDEAVDDIDRAVSYVRTELGCHGPVGLLGFSMGALAVCRWARSHADDVACIALVTPAVDLRDLHAQPGFQREIEAAIGGPNALEGALDELDPTAFASRLARIPIRIWYSSDDPVIPWRSVHRFADRHGGAVSLRSLGPSGHDPAAADEQEIADFFAAHADR